MGAIATAYHLLPGILRRRRRITPPATATRLRVGDARATPAVALDSGGWQQPGTFGGDLFVFLSLIGFHWYIMGM